MNDPVQPPNTRLSDSRTEKRQSMSVPVYLASIEDLRTAERTVTENVSPHGARVLSKRPWQPGEESIVTPLSGEFSLIARVIHCSPITGHCFRLGMEFPNRAVNWGEHFGV